MTSTDASQIQRQIRKICSSRAIGRAQAYKDLLHYLVKRSLAGAPPKEVEIAAEVFDREITGDDGFVRVYVHNLRKKLDNYYRFEGRRDGVHIAIPIGSYSVDIRQQNAAGGQKLRIGSLRQLWQPLAMLIFGLSLALNLYLGYSRQAADPASTSRDHDLSQYAAWRHILTNDRETLFVLGDFFVFTETDPELERRRTIRDSRINTENDFDDFVLDHPTWRDRVRESQNPYITKGSAFALQHLLPLFADKPLAFKLSSQVTPEDLREHNIVYLGLYKTMGPLRTFFRGSSLTLNATFDGLAEKASGQRYVLEGSPKAQHDDYGIFANYAGPKNTRVLIISGFADTALIQIARSLSDPQTLSQLEDRITAQNFEVFFRASGFDRESLEARILRVTTVDTDAIWLKRH